MTAGKIIFAFCLVAILKRGRAVNEGDNAQEFGALCAVVELATAETHGLRSGPLENMTRVIEDFRNFEKLTNSHRTSRFTPPSPEWLSEFGLNNETLDGSPWASAFQKVRERAESQYEGCSLREEQARTIVKEVSKLLKQGVFGESATEATDITSGGGIDDNAPFSGSPTYANSCASNQPGPGKTLANDIFCLCVGNDGGSAKEFCGDFKAKGGSWPKLNGGTTFPADWTTVYKACPKSKRNLTAANIYLAVESFRNLLGRGAGVGSATKKAEAPYFLGKVGTNNRDCTGVNTENVCVNYKTVLTADNGVKGLSGIKWVERYFEGARKLENFERLTEKCEHAVRQLGVLHDLTTAIFIQTIHEIKKTTSASGKRSGETIGLIPVAGEPEKVAKTTLSDPANSAKPSAMKLLTLLSIFA